VKVRTLKKVSNRRQDLRDVRIDQKLKTLCGNPYYAKPSRGRKGFYRVSIGRNFPAKEKCFVSCLERAVVSEKYSTRKKKGMVHYRNCLLNEGKRLKERARSAASAIGH